MKNYQKLLLLFALIALFVFICTKGIDLYVDYSCKQVQAQYGRTCHTTVSNSLR